MPFKTASEAKPIGAVVVDEYNAEFNREPITIVAGSGVLKTGHVLGMITASGKYEPSPATGSSGSQVASAILVDPVDATSTDQVAMAIVNGPAIVDPSELTYATSVNNDSLKAAKLVQLKAVNIKSKKGA